MSSSFADAAIDNKPLPTGSDVVQYAVVPKKLRAQWKETLHRSDLELATSTVDRYRHHLPVGRDIEDFSSSAFRARLQARSGHGCDNRHGGF